jgi:hypothetical protein
MTPLPLFPRNIFRILTAWTVLMLALLACGAHPRRRFGRHPSDARGGRPGNVTPTAQFGGNVVSGEVIEIPNLYEYAQCDRRSAVRYCRAGSRPAGTDQPDPLEGTAVTSTGVCVPRRRAPIAGRSGSTCGSWTSRAGRKAENGISPIVEIEAVNLLGMPANLVRTTGGVGSVVGTVIGFPFFEDIVRFFLGRKTRKK